MKSRVSTMIIAAALSTMMSATAFAGQWRKDSSGWWYQNDDGSYPAGTWQWIDSNGDGVAECYYFYADGYMAYNNEIDGYRLNNDGQWVIGDQVQTRQAGNVTHEAASSVSLDAYKAAIMNKSTIEKDDYYDYLRMYFGGDFGFDKYFMHDLNADGVPELFIYSTYMGLTSVYTIDSGLKLLGYLDIYGINIRTNEAVVHGHWHGAGGSNENEWHTYGIKNGSLEMTRYIDYLPYAENGGRYTYYVAASDSYNDSNRTEYEKEFQDIMNGCRALSIYRMYNLGDLSGLNNIQ